MIVFSNKIYNILRWFVQIVLPSIATLYFALSQIWPLPNGELVVGSISAVSVFLGTMLGISNMQYQARAYAEGVDVENPVESFLSKDVYEFLKWLVIMFLPAAGTLYFAFAGMWGLPYGEAVVGTISALTACLGVILGINTYMLNSKS